MDARNANFCAHYFARMVFGLIVGGIGVGDAYVLLHDRIMATSR